MNGKIGIFNPILVTILGYMWHDVANLINSSVFRNIFALARDFLSSFFALIKLIRIFLHSAVTQLTRSLVPRQLSQRQVRLHVNRVNAEWDSTSTESTRNDKIFVNVGVFCVDSVNVDSHSALTQLMWSLTPRWHSWRGVWLCVNSVWWRWIKPKHAYITSSGAF